jgi:hypothetical protein
MRPRKSALKIPENMSTRATSWEDVKKVGAIVQRRISAARTLPRTRLNA